MTRWRQLRGVAPTIHTPLATRERTPSAAFRSSSLRFMAASSWVRVASPYWRLATSISAGHPARSDFDSASDPIAHRVSSEDMKLSATETCCAFCRVGPGRVALLLTCYAEAQHVSANSTRIATRLPARRTPPSGDPGRPPHRDEA